MKTICLGIFLLLSSSNFAVGFGSDKNDVDSEIQALPNDTSRQKLEIAVETVTTDRHKLRADMESALAQLIGSKDDVLARYAISKNPETSVDIIELKKTYDAFEIRLIAWAMLDLSVADAGDPDDETLCANATRTLRLSRVMTKALSIYGVDISNIKLESPKRGKVGSWLTRVADTADHSQLLEPAVRAAMIETKQMSKDVHPVNPVIIRRPPVPEEPIP